VTTGLRAGRWALLAFVGVQMLEGAGVAPGLGRLDLFVVTLALLCGAHLAATLRRGPTASSAWCLRLVEDLAFTLLLAPPALILAAVGAPLGVEILASAFGRWSVGLVAVGAGGALVLVLYRRWFSARRGRRAEGRPRRG
jgi:hypothetical protein